MELSRRELIHNALATTLPIGAVSSAPEGKTTNKEVRVVAYLPEYRMEKFRPEHAVGVTDLVYFAIEPAANGELITKDFDPSYMEPLKEAKRKQGCKLHIALGGWEQSKGFAAMSLNPVTRKRFLRAILSFCKRQGFDGIDYDWEHPQNAAEEQAYGTLFMETKQLFQTERLTISTAMAHWQNLKPEYFRALDRVHLMAYDMDDARHSTMEHAKNAVKTMLQKGVQKQQLCLGVPFYGRKMTNHNVEINYAEIQEKFHPAPEVDEAGGYYFNGRNTICAKTRYALELGLGGVMFWEIGQDSQNETSLLRAIRTTLGTK